MSKTPLSQLLSKSIIEPAPRAIPHQNMQLYTLLFNINYYKSPYCQCYFVEEAENRVTLLRGNHTLLVDTPDKVCNFLRCLFYRLQNTPVGHAYY